jgi:hypothetical protein
MDDFHQSRDGPGVGRRRVVDLVLGGSEAGDQLDASFLGIAVEPALAGVGRLSGRQASRRLPFALPEEKWSISVTHRRHRDADALPLREEGGVTRERRSSSAAVMCCST